MNKRLLIPVLILPLTLQGCASFGDLLTPIKAFFSQAQPSLIQQEYAQIGDGKAPSPFTRYVPERPHRAKWNSYQGGANWMPGAIDGSRLGEPRYNLLPDYVQVIGTQGLLVQVFFDTDSAKIRPDDLARLKQLPPGTYYLVGHADPRGTEAYNQGLSQKRAVAVAKILLSNGAVVGGLEACGERYAHHDPKQFNVDRRSDVFATKPVPLCEPGDL